MRASGSKASMTTSRVARPTLERTNWTGPHLNMDQDTDGAPSFGSLPASGAAKAARYADVVPSFSSAPASGAAKAARYADVVPSFSSAPASRAAKAARYVRRVIKGRRGLI